MKTNLLDDCGNPIHVGDVLQSVYDYKAKVCIDGNGDLYGQLFCDDKHSCKDIPYSLNHGEGYTIIK